MRAPDCYELRSPLGELRWTWVVIGLELDYNWITIVLQLCCDCAAIRSWWIMPEATAMVPVVHNKSCLHVH